MSKYVLGNICYDITFFFKQGLSPALSEQDFQMFCEQLQKELLVAYKAVVVQAFKESVKVLNEFEDRLIAEVLEHDRVVPDTFLDRVAYVKNTLSKYSDFDPDTQLRDILALWTACGRSSWIEDEGIRFLDSMGAPLSHNNHLDLGAFSSIAHLPLGAIIGNIPITLPYQIQELPNTLSTIFFKEIISDRFQSFAYLHHLFSAVHNWTDIYKVYTKEEWDAATWL
jgi:hypothetical protein